MKIVQINGGVFGSTGNIMFGISDKLREHGMEDLCFAPVTTTNRKKEPLYSYKKIGSYNSRRFNVLLARLTGLEGCFAKRATKKAISRIKQYGPDLIHLHNLHNSFINLKMLFDYIKEAKIPVVWTLHDCWAFTGHCPYFELANCYKWKTECEKCPQYRSYPGGYIDRTKKLHKLKKECFLGIEKMVLITPSKWLNDLVKQSFLKDYDTKIIPNSINLDIFKPTESDFRKKNNLENKKLILGVSFGWGYKKGLDVFIEMAKQIPDEYRIVLVGTDEKVEKKLPSNVIPVRRTQDQKELAKIYTTADVFVNPTREEMFGMVNVEALACGTPVVTFDSGGSPECVDKTCGSVIPKNDIKGIIEETLRVCNEKPYAQNDCIKRAKKYDCIDRYEEHIDIYKELVHKKYN